MASHRSQPYRRASGRPMTAAGQAMTRGGPRYMANPAHARTRAMRKRRRKPRGGGPLGRVLGVRNRIGRGT